MQDIPITDLIAHIHASPRKCIEFSSGSRISEFVAHASGLLTKAVVLDITTHLILMYLGLLVIRVVYPFHKRSIHIIFMFFNQFSIVVNFSLI